MMIYLEINKYSKQKTEKNGTHSDSEATDPDLTFSGHEWLAT